MVLCVNVGNNCTVDIESSKLNPVRKNRVIENQTLKQKLEILKAF
jgi:hypothetical protein